MLSAIDGHCKQPHIDHAQFRRLLGFEFFVVELFMLQAAEKAFRRRIIPTICFFGACSAPCASRPDVADIPDWHTGYLFSPTINSLCSPRFRQDFFAANSLAEGLRSARTQRPRAFCDMPRWSAAGCSLFSKPAS